MNEREGFLAALAADEDDAEARLVFSDWLDEHGKHEEAGRQRRWPAAKAWLVDFAARCGQTCAGYGGAEEDWREITYADVVKAGADYVDSDYTDHFVQVGSETARDIMSDDAVRRAYWENWRSSPAARSRGRTNGKASRSRFPAPAKEAP
jgi:uncharacterized protein (TIGR02996 family)